MTYRYILVPVGLFEGETLAESRVSTDDRLAVGDVAPGSPGRWIVERVEPAGMTRWASEAAGRLDPRTVVPPVRVYCRVVP